MSAPLLRLDNINKSFAAIRAVVDVSFELLPGEVHALVGENGAGKSTLVGIITGAQRPGSGTIELNGQLLRHLTPVRARQLGVACIYQHPSLFPDLSVAENIALRLEQTGPFRRIDWKKQYRTAQDLLDSIGADIRPEARAGQLSMPHQQLVEIACALGASARIVIMDEPTSSLTQREQHHLFDLVRKLRQRGAGIIYVSHKLEEIFELADRITVLRDGQRVCTCPAGKLNESLLIRLMVGREVSSVSQAKSTTGQVVLRVLNLGCSG